MKRNVLVPIANGSEELETVSIVDVLRRAGSQVTIAAVDMPQIVASKGVRLIADLLVRDCTGETYDLIALPGGMPGAERLRDSRELYGMIRRQIEEGRLCGAICAAPAVVLDYHGLTTSRRITCHPNFRHLIRDGMYADDDVVIDGNLVTSKGAGTVLEFSLTLVELLFDEEKAREVAAGMVFTRRWH